ncbi:hypothetical protein [Neobacillus cucumis]
MINRELNEEVILQFVVTSFVGTVEWWITKSADPSIIIYYYGRYLNR